MIGYRWIVLDALVGVVICGAYVVFASLDGSDGAPVFTGPLWLGWVIAASVGLPLSVRRLWPLPVAAVVVVGCVSSAVLDLTREPFIPAAIALYAVGSLESLRRSIPAAALALAALGGALVVGVRVVTPSESLVGTAELVAVVWLLAGGGWTVGAAVRYRRLAVERAAASDRRRAAAEERVRVAREIHDIVSHNLSVIAVVAGTAHHLAVQPDRAQEVLRSIEAMSRDALAEMRGVLGMLRLDPDADGDRQPTPGLHGLPELAERARAAGVAVDLKVKVEQSLAAGLELAVYRIVQEALTNVVKHAAPAHCSVRVSTDGRRLSVCVTDDGRRTRPAPPGHGLIGVRERATMYGGEVTAGPGPDGGFTLRATLPYREEVEP